MRSIEQIKIGNDTFRRTFFRSPFHQLNFTESVAQAENLQDILTAVREYRDFTPGNDPNGEHDFGSFQLDDKYFWKIDYYEPGWDYGANPRTAPKLCRLLTIMRASEY